MKNMLACLLAMFLCFGICACAEENQRMKAEQYLYDLDTLEEGQELYVTDLIFNDTVTVSGDHGVILFANCVFNGDIVNAAQFGTRVMITEDCELNGRCILQNGVKEATLETSFPKFMSLVPMEVVCENSYGSAIAFGDMQLIFNGETYCASDAQLFFDCSNPDAGVVPYTGQESSYFVVARWWENGEENLLVECEYDPTM